jgi:hypothetical protein
VNSPQFVRQVTGQLRPVLGDDRIVTGARVLAVPPRRVLNQLSAAVYAASLLALVFVYLLARGHWHARGALIGFAAAEAAAILLGLVRIFVQRPMLLAVTGRQLVCCRLAGFGKHPASVATAPLGRARITVYRQPRLTTLRCLMPGAKPVMLNSVRGCQQDLDQVVAIARSSGVRVSTGLDNDAYRERQHADAPPPARGDRLAGRRRAVGPGSDQRADVDTAARAQRRREYPGEHRRSGRRGGEPTRS